MIRSPDKNDNHVQLEGITKVFSQGRAAVHALRGVDMTVNPSELLMIVGPSGCGKTTLLSILSGVLNPTTGSTNVFGVDWTKLTEDQKTARRTGMTGFVFQQFRLIPSLNVTENVMIPLLLQRENKKTATRRAEEMLDRVQLSDRLDAMPRELSGGMQQRVSIARALVSRPRMLVCDEPTANLDARTGQSVMELIVQACRENDEQGRPRRVVVVTHDNRIYHYADRIIEMEDGRFNSTVSKHVLEEAAQKRDYHQDNADFVGD